MDWGAHALVGLEIGAIVMTERMSAAEFRRMQGKAPTPDSKYGNRRAKRGAINFDSEAEAKRYDELVLLREAGEVAYFLRQVPFDLPGGVKYRCDFMVVHSDGRIVYEDVKGFATQGYKVKKKIVEGIYPVEIVEVRRKRAGRRKKA